MIFWKKQSPLTSCNITVYYSYAVIYGIVLIEINKVKIKPLGHTNLISDVQ